MMAFNLARILAAALLARAAAFDCATGRCPMGEGNDPAGDANESLLQECETTAFADGMVFEASSAFLLAKCCAYPDVLDDQKLLLQRN